ncbi:DgyrCDS6473 [Dimorphilus gyrociliatus]|uniref:Vacuolar-sorting protein SNF8 n=1 Tax=Dimorphilus gyrociliatus TaxID=2664684 RepID=A0A7I8VPS1_9ANNE|nr:DgyrCDS6473 [Dimorphilus gyrociliatus]
MSGNTRRRGVGAIKTKTVQASKFKEKGTELASEELEKLSTQLNAFKNNLEDFATKHKQQIKKNPEFRGQFQEMCASIGVDPLASSKGFWSEMLGVGDFYYEIGVQTIEVCLANNQTNGGIMKLDELHSKLLKSRKQDVSLSDLKTAIKKLRSLGSGFQLIKAGKNFFVQSVPGELTMDHTIILEKAQEKNGRISKSDIGWERERVDRAMDYLVKEGMTWVDDKANERLYWFPSMFSIE